MKIFIEKDNVTKELAFGGPVSKLMVRLKINRETVLIVRNGALATEDEILQDNDEIRVLSVISGG